MTTFVKDGNPWIDVKLKQTIKDVNAEAKLSTKAAHSLKLVYKTEFG